MRKAITVAILIPSLVFSFAGKKDKKKKKKKGQPDVELVGWHPVGESGGQCYHPPKFADMVDGPRKIARTEALNGIIAQWRGERDDGVAMDPKLVTNVETIFFGDPEDVETIAGENLAFCKKAMTGGGTSEWEAWAMTLPKRLTAGECKGSLLPQEMHDYLSLSEGWHMPQPFCKGERIRIDASNKDYYRVDEDGPWITADGDPETEASGEYPCTTGGCKVGQLLLRFKNYDGTIDQVVPAGTETIYTAPDHGTLYVRINDQTPADNVWKVEGGLQHHTGVSYMGAD
jgi:hypothetical protein